MREAMTYRTTKRNAARLLVQANEFSFRDAWNLVRDHADYNLKGFKAPERVYQSSEPKPTKYQPHQGTREMARRAA